MQRTLHLIDGRDATIRTAETSDAEEFIRHRRTTCAETDFLACHADEVTYTVAEEEAILESIIASPRRTMLVCVCDGHVVGFSGVSPIGAFSKSAHRASCAVSVERAFWGLGIGSALMAACIDAAREMGFELLELDCYVENARGLKRYERLGFVAWGTQPMGMRHRDGTYHDLVHMTYDLHDQRQ